MTSPFVTLSVFASALSLLAGTPPQGAQETRGQAAKTRDVYVSVVDSKGEPVTDLTAADFVVREDGVAREVLKVSPATAPMQIALLVDDSAVSNSAIPRLREGVQNFIDALAGKGEIALIEIGERPAVLVESTTNTEALKKGIGRLFARSDSGAYFLEGILDAAEGLRKREAQRPIIVAVTFENAPEFSNEHYQHVIDAVEKAGAALHVVSVGTPAGSLSDEMRNRNLLIAEGTERTGGRRDQVLVDMGIPDKMKQVARELANQMVLTYGRPDRLIPPEKLSISVTRPGLTVRARTRVVGR
jgi:Ca-activated chloride channel family protein